MTHGTISAWNKQPGDTFAPGDVLCEVETDKASVGFEVQDEGVLAKILVEAGGQEIQCGSPIALMVNDEAEYKEYLTLPEESVIPSTATKGSSADISTSDASLASAPTSLTSTSESPAQTGIFSPAARHIVQSRRIDASSVRGSVKGGRIITKGDVLRAIQDGNAKPASSPAKETAHDNTSVVDKNPVECTDSGSVTPNTASPNGSYTDLPNSNMRKVIAKRLAESKATVPHLYCAAECEIDNLMKLRKTLKNDFGVAVSVNDLVIKSAAMALRDVPECNGRWSSSTGSAELNQSVDISVAVATPTGLITPILGGADQLGLSAINSTVKDLATRARDGKLQPKEYQGGTFTISNLGMFGISSFTAVINPPQACILAVGGGIQRVLPPVEHGGEPRVVTTMTVQMSSDRRVVDEATASQFLQAFQYYLSNPTLLM
eukprot:CAMPEP_0185021026 /NCGR_PEP_ID=MMETSP1103-20130426/3688_1 /TAXON_ID=36769 /ORGANISM="Paraphysomonas bandaiensis, Strain Caron Lab Isolate" /LENGTH=433 /DNA_ID=CAMNT_0027552299 /DNA_START=261 /DNA_END=1559 /DNA_ORIENTATION=+